MDSNTAKKVNQLFERFERENINYALLRNYENIEKEEDVDLILDAKDFSKARRILKELGLIKERTGLGFFMVLDKVIDIKPGCLEYGKCYVKSAKQALKERRKYKRLYILGKEEELSHLIVKSLGRSGDIQNSKYFTRIKTFLQQVNKEKLKAILLQDFGKVGIVILEAIEKEEYDKLPILRKKLLRHIHTLPRRIKYLWYRLVFRCVKR